MRILGALSMCLLVAGCATPRRAYDGPERPPEQLARLYLPDGSSVEKVNDKDISLPFSFEDLNTSRFVFILPGHSIVHLHKYLTIATAYTQGETANGAVEFDAVANHTYELTFGTASPTFVVRDLGIGFVPPP